MSNETDPKSVVELTDWRIGKDEVDRHVEGETFPEALENADLDERVAVIWRDTVYNPVWHSCAECTYRAVHTDDDPLVRPPEHGVFEYRETNSDESGVGRNWICTVCEREVEPKIENIELITERWGPEDTDTRRLMIDRIAGYVPANEDYSETALDLARERWEDNARALLAYAGLTDVDSNTMIFE